MASAFIGIGSSLGDRLENCAKAIGGLERFASIKQCSSLYETEPVGRGDQPRFVNAVAKIATSLTPYELMSALLRLEREMGRRREIPGGARVIDLDLLFYEDFVIATPALVVPHPRAHQRRFVLVPLCELDGGLVHPKLRREARELLEALEDDKGVAKLSPPPLPAA